MAVTVHLMGGPSADHEPFRIPEPLAEMLIPSKVLAPSHVSEEDWTSTRYIRRPRHLTPASFVRRHGPDAWIYDWEKRPTRAQRAYAQAILPTEVETWGWSAFLALLSQLTHCAIRELDKLGGQYDRRDLEWTVNAPYSYTQQDLRLLRVEVVMEVPA
jgi:hypothetical protein